MPGVRTNHAQHAFAPDDFAVFTQSLYRNLDLHGAPVSPADTCSNNKPLNSKHLDQFLKKNWSR